MIITESIVEDAALEWFGEQSRVAPTLIPAFSQGEKEAYGEVVLVGRLREAIRRQNPAISDEASVGVSPADRRAAIKQCLKFRFERKRNA